MGLSEACARYLSGQTHGTLATLGADGYPQNKPVGYRFNPGLGTIDISGFNMESSAKYRNVGVRPEVAFVVDDAFGEGAEGVRFLEVRGRSEQVTVEPPSAGLSSQIIRIHPRRVISWNLDPEHPGLQTHDLTATSDGDASTRPMLGSGSAVGDEAIEAVTRLVEELQAGWDSHDADITDRSLAEDVVWGSPFGETVHGYEQLHAIHIRLKEQGAGGPSSRFEIAQVLAPTPDVAIAQVRRVALDPDGQALPPTADATVAFSETVLYVMVKRNRTWWLAAGQNTPVRPLPH